MKIKCPINIYEKSPNNSECAITRIEAKHDSKKQIEFERTRSDLLLAKEVPDLDGGVVVGDGRIDRKVGVDEAHPVAVALGDSGNEILDVADGGTDGSGGLPRSEPRLNLQLLPSLDEGEVEVEVLKASRKLPSRSLDHNDLSVHLQRDPLGDVHCSR